MGGRMSSKMTGTGRRRKKNGTKAKRTVSVGGREYKVLGPLDSMRKLRLPRRKNKIDIKETGLK